MAYSGPSGNSEYLKKSWPTQGIDSCQARFLSLEISYPTERETGRGVSSNRVAIREALRTAGESGFIVTRQGANGGAYVTDLSFEFLANGFVDLFLGGIRFPFLNSIASDLFIETQIARLAALGITPEFTQR